MKRLTTLLFGLALILPSVGLAQGQTEEDKGAFISEEWE